MISEKIQIGEQILASVPPQGLFIARITEVKDRSIKIDYCIQSVWDNMATVFCYTMFVPISVLILDTHGELSLKPWFITKGLKSDKIYHIKKYMINDKGEKAFI